MSEQLAMIRRGWQVAVAAVIPDLAGVPELLESRLHELGARGAFAEPELLAVVEETSQFVLTVGTPDLARDISKRLRRGVYEFLLALDARSPGEGAAEWTAEPAPPPPGHADEKWVAPARGPRTETDGDNPTPSWLQRRADAPLAADGGSGGSPSGARGGDTPVATASGKQEHLDPRLVAPRVGFHLTDPDELVEPGDKSGPRPSIASERIPPAPSMHSMMIGEDEVPAVPGRPPAVAGVTPTASPEMPPAAEVPAAVADAVFFYVPRDLPVTPAAATPETQPPSGPGARHRDEPEHAWRFQHAAAPDRPDPSDLSDRIFEPVVSAHPSAAPGSPLSERAVRAPAPDPAEAADLPTPPPGPEFAIARDAPEGDAPNRAGGYRPASPPSIQSDGAGDDGGRWQIRPPRVATSPTSQSAPASDEWDHKIRDDAGTFDAEVAAARAEIGMLLKRKKFDHAGAILQQLAQESGGRAVAELALDVGDHCRASGKRMAATSCYLAASRADPVFEEPLARLADICIDDKDADLAVSYLERIARLTRLRGDVKGALRIYRKIHVVAPYRDDILELLMRAQTTGHLD